MDEQAKSPKKPLRNITDKGRDIYNTYLKNEGVRNIHIHTPEKEEEKMKEEQEIIKETPAAEEKAAKATSQAAENEIIEIVEKYQELLAEKDELLEQLKRKTAEMENFRRRTLKEKQDMLEYANERLLFKLLPILDDISNAIDAGKKSEDYAALLKGVEMIRDKTLKLFEEAGVKEMDSPIGAPFDVAYHEAVMMTPSNEFAEGAVVFEALKGYMLNEKVLRHAKVITSSGPSDAPKEKEIKIE